MNKKKKAVSTVLDIWEVGIPSAIFAVVFVLYLMMIAFRYILNWKIAPIYELTQVLYLECAMLAASYGGRTDKHVVFPLIYDKCSDKLKKIFRVLADLFVVILSAILIAPSWDSISFIAKKKTSVLKIPFNFVYFPFLVLFVLSFVYYSYNLVKDFTILTGKETMKEEKSDD